MHFAKKEGEWRQRPSFLCKICQIRTNTSKGNVLDKWTALCYNQLALKESAPYRGVEQLEARRAHNPEVVGSSPASATIKTPDFERDPVFF